MAEYELLIKLLGLAVVGTPVLLLMILGVASLIDRPCSEKATCSLVQSTNVIGLLSSIAILFLMLLLGIRHVSIDVGSWVVIPHYHFSIKFVFDRLSVPFAIMTFVLCGTIGSFAARYMHRERGFNRFFLLYSLFMLGMVVTSLSNTIETLFAGWELVGLSSAMLVGFFHYRMAPVQNGLRVWVVYRISDAALLIASVVMHHLTGEGDFDVLLGKLPWPEGQALLSPTQALFVGSLLLIAAAGKSALIPFSGWLPRAMEGPTPSSAVFYGALSVHLGAFLLLRVSPVLDLSPGLNVAIVGMGLATAIFASVAGRVQTDIKSALSFASLTQVGLIVAEIGFGLRYLALIHILGHGCLRTLQMVRAPTLLQDYLSMENNLGARLPRLTGRWERLIPPHCQTWLYRIALERGCLDAWLTNWFVTPFMKVLTWCDGLERRWTDFLAGGPSRESERVPTRARNSEHSS